MSLPSFFFFSRSLRIFFFFVLCYYTTKPKNESIRVSFFVHNFYCNAQQRGTATAINVVFYRTHRSEKLYRRWRKEAFLFLEETQVYVVLYIFIDTYVGIYTRITNFNQDCVVCNCTCHGEIEVMRAPAILRSFFFSLFFSFFLRILGTDGENTEQCTVSCYATIVFRTASN